MKKILVLVLAMVTIIAAQAQKKRITDGRRDLRDKMLTEKLNLSEEQKQKAKTLNEDYRKKMTELRKKEDITVKEQRTQMMELNKKHREDMRGLLSKDQKEQIEKMKLERKKMAEIDGDARMEKMKLRLDLNNEQVEKIKKQRTEMREKIKAIQENNSLDMTKKREEMKALLQERKESMKSILTEEQQQKMQERNKLMKRKRKLS